MPFKGSRGHFLALLLPALMIRIVYRMKKRFPGLTMMRRNLMKLQRKGVSKLV